MFRFLKKNQQGPTTLYAPANGTFMLMEDVKDPMFAQKMMGDGYAVYPSDGTITSPVEGEIITIFPTKHAIGIRTRNDEEVILHIGINTVELDGIPFTTHVKEGDKICVNQTLVDMDINYLKERDIDPSIIVVFTNLGDEKQIKLNQVQDVCANQIVGTI